MSRKFKQIGKNYQEYLKDEKNRKKNEKKFCRSCSAFILYSKFNYHVLRCKADKFDKK